MNSICKFKTCRITKFTSYELQFSTMYKKYRQLDKMMKNSGFLWILFLLLTTASKSVAKDTPLIYQIDIKKEIDNTTRIYLSNGLSEANSLGADAILIHMNTYGGLLEAADSMRTAILYKPCSRLRFYR